MFHIPAHKNVEHPAGQIVNPVGFPPKPASPDFDLLYAGSVSILTPMSDEGRAWCDEYLPDDATRWGRYGYVIEGRYVGPIHAGIVNDGLVIRGGGL